MNIALIGPLALAGYLLGSVSSARIVARRVMPEEDISTTQIEIPGGARILYDGVSATSLGARSGPKWGIVVGLADMAKAFFPTLITRVLWPDSSYHLIVAVAAMVGHNWPVFHRFKGGRGQSTLIGGLLAVDWLALPVTTAVGTAVGLFIVRDMVVAYTLGQILLIPWFIWRAGAPEVGYAIAVNLLFIIPSVSQFEKYLEKRRAGEVRQIHNWRDFRTSHPGMGPNRFEED